MSVRVNLLPEATKQRDVAARQRAVAGLVGLLLLAALGGVYWWAQAQVRDAEDRLAAEQDRTTQLRAEEAELAAFRDLADRRDTAATTLSLAMRDEVSLAGLLQDIAAVMPTDTQLEAVAISLPPAPPDDVVFIGNLTLSGKTLTSHAPGVERVLLQLDKIAGFDELYLNSSSLDDPEGRIATFSLDGQLRREVRTDRYAGGFPEALR